MVEPARADAEGLLSCLGEALHRTNISNIFSAENILNVDQFPVLVGAGYRWCISKCGCTWWDESQVTM